MVSQLHQDFKKDQYLDVRLFMNAANLDKLNGHVPACQIFPPSRN